MMRKTIYLNWNWYFKRDFLEDHIRNYKNILGFERVDIPHTNQVLDYNYLPKKIYELVSTYKKVIFINEEYQGKVLKLVFEGVAHACDLYLNEHFLLRHEGGYTEFEVDISNVALYGQENYLTVIVDSTENENIPPFGLRVDYLGYGGIYREVQLLVLEQNHIERVYLDHDNIDGNDINLRVETKREEGKIKVDILDKGQIIYENFYPVTGKISSFKATLQEKVLWCVDNPYLYDIQVQLLISDQIVDMVEHRFGFREAKFTKEGFFLNRKPLKLRGLNRHQSYPYVGYAMPKSAQEKDADILKFDLGCNIVRTSHYPQSKHFLNRCDEIGLLVFEEIPGWNYIGGKKFQENTLANVRAMIERDYNHPSIILWGVRINESMDNSDLYQKTNMLAHKLDPIRQTAGVRNITNSEFLEDVYTYNDFIHSGNNQALTNPKKVKKGVPYLVSEYNGHMFPTKSYDDEKHRVEHALRHYQVLDAASRNQAVSGTIGWCMSDYNTHDDFGSGDNICHHGVLDMFRLPKYATYIYSSQQDEKIVLEVLSRLNPGEYPIGIIKEIYIATNADYVKLFKNGEYIGNYYPEKKSLPHPLIKIDDFIGNQLSKNEGISEKDAERIKKLFQKIAEYGTALPLRYKLQIFYYLKKYRWKYEHAAEMFYKYHYPSGTYRFDAYLGDKKVKTVIRELAKEPSYTIEADCGELVIDETYDVTRIVVKKVDQNQEVLPYAFDAFRVRAEAGIDLIGPDTLALNAGQVAFWVRTNGLANHGKIIVNFPNQELIKYLKIKGVDYEN